MRNFLSGEKRGIYKFAITCAVMVSSVAFAAGPGYAVDIDNGTDGAANSIRNSSYYTSGNTLNIITDKIEITGDLPVDDYTISGITNLIINGNGTNGTVINSYSTNDNYNYGYRLNNSSSMTMNNLTFDNFGLYDWPSRSSVSLYGAGLHIQDNASTVVLNNVSYTNNLVRGETYYLPLVGSSVVNGYGGAIANDGNLVINGGVFSGNRVSSEQSPNWGLGNTGNAYGGAIYNNHKLTLTGVSIQGNSVSSEANQNAALGGGIYTTNGITLAGGNRFSNNTDLNGTRNNDIYFAGGDLNVNGSGSGEYNIISGGIASANGNSKIVITDGGKLRLEGNNSDFSGGATVAGEGSVLTYAGNLTNSILNATTTVNGNGGTVELIVDSDYALAAGKIITKDGVTGKFVKSGNAELVLDNGDYSQFTGDVVINGGSLTFSDANGSYFNSVSNAINGNTLNFANNNAANLNKISGSGTLNKTGVGELTVTGDNSEFTGDANINAGSLTFADTNGDKFFANNARVGLSGTTLNYTAQSAITNLNNANFADLSLTGDAVFNYTANSGTTNISNDFYTVISGTPSFSFTGNSNADFVLNNNLDGINQVTFNNTALSFAGGLTSLTNSIALDNTAINVLDQSIKDYTFNNLTTGNNSSLRLDVNLNSTNPAGDVLSFNSGEGVLKVTEVGIIDDNGTGDKTVKVLNNSDGSSVSLLTAGEDTKIAGWSTNVFEYEIDAASSNNNTIYDSLTFKQQQAASPDSLKKMNNYQVTPTRGFSLIENAATYNIARDLEQTENGTFTVNGVGKDKSIISGYRVEYDVTYDGEGNPVYNYHTDADGNYIVSKTDKGSFFELTDNEDGTAEGSKTDTTLNIHDITIQDADRTAQTIQHGSIIYSTIDNAVINIKDAAFKNSHAADSGGAFYIANAQKVNIKGSDFTDLTAGGLGGAIYSAIDLNITDSKFSGNKDSAGKNDITLANKANISFTVSEGQTSNISSGLKTDNSNESTLTKTGAGTLNISGNNTNYTGSVDIKAGKIEFDTANVTDSFFGMSDSSKINIGTNTILTINNKADAALSGGHFAGSGGLNMFTDNFTLCGNNAGYTGNAVLKGTELTYIAQAANDTIFGGTVEFLDGASLSTREQDSLAYTGGNFSSNSNAAVFNKNDSGVFTLDGNNSGFQGTANLKAGATNFDKGENTSFFGGNVVLDSVLNYTANADETLSGAFSGSGTINKDGEQTLTLSNSTFAGTANVSAGTLDVTSTNASADDFDFTANISNSAALKYTAGENSSLTLGGENSKLNFVTGAQGATADITASSIVLDTIANASGNNIKLNGADVSLNNTEYKGIYTLNNSHLGLMDSNAGSNSVSDRIKNYTFDSLTANNSTMDIDVSLGANQGSDKLVVNGGSGSLDITEFAIIDDNGQGGTKTVQVIQNNNGSEVGLAVGESTRMAEWSTNVYEYIIDADKSSGSQVYDSIKFEATKGATPDSLRTMNHEKDGVRGFSVIANSTYNIGRDLDETLAGKFTVNGAGKDKSVISGYRVEYDVTYDGEGNPVYNYHTDADGNYIVSKTDRGSFFEVVNDTDLSISNITIQDANRVIETADTDSKVTDGSGSIVHLNSPDAKVTIKDSALINSSAEGNGGAVAAHAGELAISGSNFTDNKSEGLGGALYAATTVNISTSTFSGNKDSNGANDIYVAQGGIVNFTGAESTISGGLAGVGTVNKDSSEDLNLSGINSGFTGKLNIVSGALNFNADETTDSYIAGVTNISSGANVNILNKSGQKLDIAGTFEGDGRLNIGNDAADNNSVTINGNNSAFKGNANVTNGQLIVKMDDANDAYFADSSLTFVDNGTLTFDVAEDINKTITSTGSNFASTGGTFEKAGAGNLSITGDWSGMQYMNTAVNGGVLEFVANSAADLMISGDINVVEDAVFKVTNGTGSSWSLTNSLKGKVGSTFEVAANNSTVDISGGSHSEFFGETLVSSGNLAFIKSESNSFVAGGVNLSSNDSKLTYTTTSDDSIPSALKGTGTLDKQGTGSLTVNDKGFTGTADVNAGTLNFNAQAGAGGSFGFDAQVADDSTLNFTAGSAGDVYNVNDSSGFVFDNTDGGGTINFTTGSYNLSSDLVNAQGNTTSFTNSVVNVITAEGQTSLELDGNYALDNSTLNLADGKVTTTSVRKLTGSGALKLDFDFTGNNGQGAFDTLTANGGDASLMLNNINTLNLTNDRGLIVDEQVYDVLSGATFANDYSSELQSALYTYTVSATQGGTAISVVASGYVGNTLYTMNHEMTDKRTFHLAGDSTQYYIGQELKETLAGTLNIVGRTQDKKDTIIATSGAGSTTGLSMFEVVYDNTTLNIKDVTIQGASSDNGGSVIYQNNANSTVNVTNSTLTNNSTSAYGGAVSINNGTAEFANVQFSANSADRAGALRVSGGKVTVKNSSFTDNTATSYGGAISTPHSKSSQHSEIILDIQDTIFSRNKVTSNSNSGGGAISLGDLITTTITGSKFENNSAQSGNGGAIYNESTGLTNESTGLTMSDVEFNGNTAKNGSAIYNLGTVSMTDATFSNNSVNYIYNGAGSEMTITSDEIRDYTLSNNVAGSTITNNGTLNLTAVQNGSFTLADALSGTDSEARGTVNTLGTVNFNNLVTNSIVNVKAGTLAVNGTGSEVNDALVNSDLNIDAGASASLGNKNISGGMIKVAASTQEGTENGKFNINNTENIAISAGLSGAGTVNKEGAGTVSLSGKDNYGFSGDMNITNGTVSFAKTDGNTFFASDADINIKGSGSKFEYSSTEASRSFNDTFANVNLNDGGTVSVSGNGIGASTYTLSSGWLSSDGSSANNMVFGNASYILNTLYTHTDVNDSITFNSSNVSIGSGIQGTEITDGRHHEAGALDYAIAGADYTLNGSTLDLSNKVAGDSYIFDKLVAKDDSAISLDVNLYLEHDENNNITVAPYADTITAGAGSNGVVEITKLYITDDNGYFVTKDDGNLLTKGVIQVFKGVDNALKVADTNNTQILSWATNVYKYGVKSAQTDREADSIEVMPDGASSTDTLRDMNIYNHDGNGGNRGFSFIAKNGLQENNNYNIYRDLDNTSAGNFTVVGTLAAENAGEDKIHKSVLSGQLKELVLLKSENKENLKQIDVNTWEYNGETFDAEYISPLVINEGTPDEDIQYTIKVGAFTPAGQTNGSMFEIVNATNFEMTDVAVRDAKRYETDTTIKDGSVIYANNEEAKITLENVDFIKNSVEAGNGGAVANLLSNQFSLKQSIISGNTASGDGGAIYNTSSGMTIANTVADGNKSGGRGGAIYTSANMQITDSNFGTTALNTHQNGEQNDIYIDGSATLAFVTTENNTSTINSGIAGSGTSTFNKSGAGTLNLNGNNEDFAGTFYISSGNVVYTANDGNDSFVGGSVKVNKDTVLTMDIAASSATTVIKDQIMQNVSGGADGSGSIIKNGAGTLNLVGANSGFTGSTTINKGSVVYTAATDTDRYFGGSTKLAGDDTNRTNLTLIVEDGVENQTVSRISGVASSTINKQGEGDLNLSGDNSEFYGVAYVENGKLIYIADEDTDKYFGGSTEISGGAELVANVALQAENGSYITGQTIGNITGVDGAKFTKTGYGEIQLVGDNSSFTGITTISNGILAYSTSADTSYVKGNTVINETGTLEYKVGNALSDSLTAISGKGTLDKLGEGTLNLVGDNSGFVGTVDITGGILAYTTADDSKFINAKSYNIAQNAELYINNTTEDIVNVSNLNSGVGQTSSGSVIKEGAGTLNLGGNNSNFEGTLDINSGAVTFERNENTSYIAGTTDIASDASLNYNTVVADTIKKVTGSGTLNKGGNEVLTFVVAENSVGSDFTANVNEGTLKVTGNSTTGFDFNMNANNQATLDYTAAENSEITLGSDSIVKFGKQDSGATINFNSASTAQGTYILAGDVANYQGNQIEFNNSTLNLTAGEYKGNYTITDSIIDLINDVSETKTFASLSTTGSTIKIDVDLTLPEPASDKLVSNGGNGGVLKIALDEIHLNDTKTDDGKGQQYTINVLEGDNLTLDDEGTLDSWATSAYEYSVDIDSTGQNIILEAIKAADENSLKAMNQYDPNGNGSGGNRGFQFHADDNPYVIGSDLGETTAGSFIVTGDTENASDTIISGEDSKSFFEVVNDTDLTVENVTIQDAHSENGGSVVTANNDSANIVLDNVNLISSSSAGNGGVINNTVSESFVITDSKITDNTSEGLGGAIYTETGITITDTDFSNNSDKNGKNDIYASGENAVVDIIAANKVVSVASGIAGDGTVNKTGSNDLNLSGKNDDFTGDLNVSEGNLNYTQTESGDTYISGNTNIAGNSTVNITNNLSGITTGSFSGDGTLNKDGSEDMTLSGDNSKFTGTMNINDGSVVYNADSSTYIAGITNINQEGTLAVNTSGSTSLSNINGTGTVDKNGSGTLLFTGNNDFNGNLKVNQGAFGLASGATLGNIDAQFAAGTGINLQNTSVVDLGDGTFTTDPNPASIENLYFNSLTLLGDVDLDIDIDLKNEIADRVGAGTVYGNGSLILDQDSLNVVSDSLLKNTSVQVAYGALADRVALDQGVTTVMGPIQKYDVSYENGSLFFNRQGGNTPDIGSVNPAVMASSVATQVGGYLTQLQTLNAGFYHMNRYTKYPYMLRLTAENTNKYALTETPSLSRSYLPETSNAMWIQPYTTFEKVNLRGGIGVSNVAYGAMYGGDSDLVDLGRGYKGVLSAFVGYNGSHMSFNGVSMNMQGGALGLTGTVYKGNFFTGLTLSTGASAGDAYTQYGTDHFAMLTAGIASKTGYNLELKDGKVIVQPTLFLGYTFTNTFDYTNAAGVRIDSDPLHAITVAPGVKVIGNLKNGWQPYAGVNMVWSIMDKTNVTAQDVRLPQLSTKPYVEYGVGVQKSWGQRFTAFFQTMIRNVGRTGIVLTAGFRWTLGKEPKNIKDKSVQDKTQRKVIKSL